MRWSRFPFLYLLAIGCVHMSAQHIPDFNDAVDPATFKVSEAFLQLDTISHNRAPVSLQIEHREFSSGRNLSIETFYQKSDNHHLLELSKYYLPLDHLHIMSEGLGKTYFRISDGICTVISVVAKSANNMIHEIIKRDCTL